MSKVPKRLGNYEMVKFIRSTAISQVWRAIEVHSRKEFMVEVLTGIHQSNRESVKLLRKEFEHGSSLEHPNVVLAVDFQVDRGISFLVQEYFSSQTMRQIMLSPQRETLLHSLFDCISQVGSALRFIHKQGWVHGNISPACILLNGQMKLKLTGLSLARRYPQSKVASVLTHSTSSGSLNYASSELIKGKSIDPRSDIYSFGCVLFELVEQKPPYTGETVHQVMQKHSTGAVSRISTLKNDIHLGFADLVYKMMQKAPDDRPENMDRVLKEAEGIFHREVQSYVSEKVANIRTNLPSNTSRSSTRAKNGATEESIRSSIKSNHLQLKSASDSMSSRWPRFVLWGGIPTLALAAFASLFWIQSENDSNEREFLKVFHGYVTEIELAPPIPKNAKNVEESSELRSKINSSIEQFAQVVPEGNSKRPDRLELRWAANLLPRAHQEKTEVSGRNKIVGLVKQHLENADRHLSSRATKREKSGKARARYVQKWLESDMVFGCMVVIDIVGLAMVTRLVMRPKKNGGSLPPATS